MRLRSLLLEEEATAMPCQPFIIWRPVPDKSRFQATAKGDDNVFDAQVTVESSSGLSKTIPLPAEVPINSGDHAAFDVLLNITSKPPADKPVILDLRIVDKNNK